MVEHAAVNRGVPGSSPGRGASRAGEVCASPVLYIVICENASTARCAYYLTSDGKIIA